MLNETNSIKKGIFVKIQRFSTHDGPGIRTTIFLKGCPLKCIWCGNPETQNPNVEIQFDKNKCISECSLCTKACNRGALRKVDEHIVINRQKCDLCGKCVEACYKRALSFVGEEISISQIINLIKRDKIFYDKSGGGVTFSGGEPLLQPCVVQTIARTCNKLGIQTALDTSGYADWNTIKGLLNYMDLVLYDLKIVDCKKHQRLTGVKNDVILDNARKINSMGIPLVLRIPIIPGINDKPEDLRLLAEFINSFTFKVEINLLPYHRLGIPKYKMLGREYKLEKLKQPSPEQLKIIKERLEEYGVRLTIVS